MITGIPYVPTTRWAISSGGSLSFGEVGAVGGIGFFLMDNDSKLMYSGSFIGAGVSAGLKVDVEVSTISWTEFLTDEPRTIDDFDNCVTYIAGLDATAPIAGGSLACCNFIGLSTTPENINLSGMTYGGGFGASIILANTWINKNSVQQYQDPTANTDSGQSDSANSDAASSGDNICQ